MPLDNYDLILGAQWLATLGDIIWNFNKLEMSFAMQGQSYKLQGKMEGSLNLSDWEEMSRLLAEPNQLTSMQLISIVELWPIQGTACEQLESIDPFQHNSDLQKLLLNFVDVFKEPNGLPPKREHDHKIELKEGTNPISCRPLQVCFYTKGCH